LMWDSDATAMHCLAVKRATARLTGFAWRDMLEGGKARRVVTGPSQRDEVVVESGIEAGDRLIVVGQRSVADGDRIRIVTR